MTDKILYRVLFDEYEEVARIFFEIKETGEQIEGTHQIQKWINNLFNENEQLKSKNRGLQSELQIFKEDVTRSNLQINKLADENEQLKKQKARYKRLSEIRNEEINNRILTIKEFIDNCSNEEVKKELEDLFYSEVNEYDLSKKYRKLHEENEDLKEDNAILRQALTRLVEAFNDKISDKSPIRDLIKITNQCSFCKECYFVDESKKFICKLNKKEINYTTPACENFDESIWRKKFKDVENAIVDNIMRDFLG